MINFETLSIFLDKKDFLDEINNCKNSIKDENRISLLKEPYTKNICSIDKQIREKFKIPNKNRLLFSLYNSPKNIKNNREDVMNRFIIVTDDVEVFIYKGSKVNEKKIFEKNELYCPLNIVGPLLEYSFNSYKIKTKRKIKKNNNYYVLIFDYLFNKDELKNIFSKFLK